MSAGIYMRKASAICLAVWASSGLLAHAQTTVSQTSQLSQGPQAPLSAQERLDAIRQSLVDASLQTPTRVITTSWIDANGSLRESSSFKNGMEVRGVKVIAYDRDESGQAKARLQHPASNSTQANKTSNSAAPETGIKGALQKLNKMQNKVNDFVKELIPHQEAVASACTNKVGSRMSHLVSLELDIDSSANAVILNSLLPQLQLHWVQTSAPVGQVSAWKAVNNLPAASMSNHMTAYERALIGNRPNALPWQGSLKIRTEALASTGFEGLMGLKGSHFLLNLDFKIMGAEGQSEMFEENVSLTIEMDRPAWSAPRPTAASLEAVQEQLQSIRGAAEQWLSCHAITPAVTAVNLQQVQINAGSMSGVKKGDEWLIANPAHFPAALVSKDGAPQTLLARVQAVTPFNSQLLVLAGPVQSVQADWRAWPTETLVKEPSVQPSKGAVTLPPAKRNVKTAASSSNSVTMTPF